METNTTTAASNFDFVAAWVDAAVATGATVDEVADQASRLTHSLVANMSRRLNAGHDFAGAGEGSCREHAADLAGNAQAEQVLRCTFRQMLAGALAAVAA